jgi:competence protein ComGC
MTLINEKLKGFFDLENFDPSLSSMKNNQTIKSHQAKNKKRKTKKLNGKQAKTTKTQKPFLSFILTL